MKLLGILLFTAALIAKDLPRCRIVAITGGKITHSQWQYGRKGCDAVQANVRFADNLFGDYVTYVIQLQSGKNIQTLSAKEMKMMEERAVREEQEKQQR